MLILEYRYVVFRNTYTHTPTHTYTHIFKAMYFTQFNFYIFTINFYLAFISLL